MNVNMSNHRLNPLIVLTMAADGIQQTTLGWQIRKLSQNISEWIELRLSGPQRVENSPPSFELPPWLGSLLVWVSIIVGVLLVSWFLWRLLVYYLDSRPAPSQSQALLEEEAKPTLSVTEWLRQAKRWEQAGNWSAACRALYMAALQTLHDRKWVSHLHSRTDGEYLQTLDQVSQPRPYQLLIRTHERDEFGGILPTAENLKRCQHAYREIEKK